MLRIVKHLRWSNKITTLKFSQNDAWMQVRGGKNNRIELVLYRVRNYRICIMIFYAWYGCKHSEENVHCLHWLFPLHKQEKISTYTQVHLKKIIINIVNIYTEFISTKLKHVNNSNQLTSAFNFVMTSCRLHTAIHMVT